MNLTAGTQGTRGSRRDYSSRCSAARCFVLMKQKINLCHENYTLYRPPCVNPAPPRPCGEKSRELIEAKAYDLPLSSLGQIAIAEKIL